MKRLKTTDTTLADLNGNEITHVSPLDVELYDTVEVGPMFAVKVAGHEGFLHVFNDEIEGV